jgi:uncharacterized damage-inducible protein DinB
MNGKLWLEQVVVEYNQQKNNAIKGAEQVSDNDFFTSMGGNPNSIAIIMKHLAGSHYSRWKDFLTTDGEKIDRERDSEFLNEGETRGKIYEKWETGWKTAIDTLTGLDEEDLDKTITIWGAPLTVMQAIQKNLIHTAYHTGQIVHLARQFAGNNWQTLSIEAGKSKEHNKKMIEKYGNWWEKENK